jgi:NAD(P)-dependent dehydrogenase (short-subunit alcohol dehydrogenase family)
MIIDLTGRKVIVTGSTADSGRATAERLARAGAAVVVVNGSTNARVEVQCGRFGKYCPMRRYRRCRRHGDGRRRGGADRSDS